MINRLLLIAAFLFLNACSSPKKMLSEKAKNVKVLKNKSTNCSVIGKYEGKNNGGSVELARNHARNLAAEDGSTAIYFTEEFANGAHWVVHAIGYDCN